MAAQMDDLKRVLAPLFIRDVRTVEPEKKGVIVGDRLRIYEEKSGLVVKFLKGTDEKTRKNLLGKLDQARIEYKLGQDFAT